MSDSFFVTRTMAALEMLAFQPASAPQVADVLRVDARTARRLLNRLTEEGWLTRTEGHARTYSLSLRLVALAAHFAERAPLACAAQDVVAALQEQTGGSAHLAVPSYRAVLCLVQRATDADARPHRRELVPAHASAAGKVLLGLRPRWRDSVLQYPLDRLTDRTIVDPDAVRVGCAACAQRGLGSEVGEYVTGRESIAAPVRDPAGEPIAAVGVTSTRARECEVAVRAAAAEVEARLAADGSAW